MPVIDRNLAEPLRDRMRHYPVVTVTGPRQSGKTTLCRAVCSDRPFVTLEGMDMRAYAREDPRGFLHEFREGAVIDEVQRAPDLPSYLQGEVDRNPQPGRFVLTGSQHFGLSEAVNQSLAGRVGTLHLLPPSFDELRRFGGPRPELPDVLWTGAYPRIHDRCIPADIWLRDYFATYVERDVRTLRNVTDLEAFSAFVGMAGGEPRRNSTCPRWRATSECATTPSAPGFPSSKRASCSSGRPLGAATPANAGSKLPNCTSWTRGWSATCSESAPPRNCATILCAG